MSRAERDPGFLWIVCCVGGLAYAATDCDPPTRPTCPPAVVEAPPPPPPAPLRDFGAELREQAGRQKADVAYHVAIAALINDTSPARQNVIKAGLARCYGLDGYGNKSGLCLDSYGKVAAVYPAPVPEWVGP